MPPPPSHSPLGMRSHKLLHSSFTEGICSISAFTAILILTLARIHFREVSLVFCSEYRDQGFTRPKVLILVPFRDSVFRIVNHFIRLLTGGPDSSSKVFPRPKRGLSLIGFQVFMEYAFVSYISLIGHICKLPQFITFGSSA